MEKKKSGIFINKNARAKKKKLFCKDDGAVVATRYDTPW